MNVTKLRCPTCDKAVKPREEGNQAFPFCSERCRMADLGRWLNEEYRIPAEESAPDEANPIVDEEEGR